MVSLSSASSPPQATRGTEWKDVDRPPPPTSAVPDQVTQAQQAPPTPLPSGLKGYWYGLTTISPSTEVERLKTGSMPCVRNSAMLGIVTGTVLSGVGVVARRPLKSSLNWGVGAFLAVTVAAYETCRSSRAAEKKRVQVFVDEYKRKKGPGSGGPEIFVGNVDA